MSTSKAEALTQSAEAAVAYDVGVKKLGAWKIKELAEKTVFLQFKAGNGRWMPACQRLETVGAWL